MVEGKGRENWEQVTERTVAGIAELGKFTDEETALVREMQEAQQVLPSGRWLWTGGTEWLKDPKNFSGSYNCTSTRVTDIQSLALMMICMMGSGTGAVIEERYISQLPEIRTESRSKTLVMWAAAPKIVVPSYVEVRGNTVTIDCVQQTARLTRHSSISFSNEFDHTRPVCAIDRQTALGSR